MPSPICLSETGAHPRDCANRVFELFQKLPEYLTPRLCVFRLYCCALSRTYESKGLQNSLGLSKPVPAKTIYLTDGPNNAVRIGRRRIYFKHARPKAMAGLEGQFALVV